MDKWTAMVFSQSTLPRPERQGESLRGGLEPPTQGSNQLSYRSFSVRVAAVERPGARKVRNTRPFAHRREVGALSEAARRRALIDRRDDVPPARYLPGVLHPCVSLALRGLLDEYRRAPVVRSAPEIIVDATLSEVLAPAKWASMTMLIEDTHTSLAMTVSGSMCGLAASSAARLRLQVIHLIQAPPVVDQPKPPCRQRASPIHHEPRSMLCDCPASRDACRHA